MSAANVDRSRPMTFRYEPGSVIARFSHSTFDYIALDLRMGGETTWIRQWETARERETGEPLRVATPSVEQTVYFSSVECAFPSLARFLEAVVIGVEECAFSWCAEGPAGEMRWRGSAEDGQFTLSWSAGGERTQWSTHLSRRNLVASLYGAFRSFVESDAYDALRYESLHQWEYYGLLLRDATVGDLARALASLSANDVERVLRRLGQVAGGRRDDELNRREPLEWFLSEQDDEEPDWITVPAAWEHWDSRQRLRHLGRRWGGQSNSAWYGGNLRELKSLLVEEWLAKGDRPAR